ncbi:Golgi uridine diphosphate-N-acetylglucosamine transporter [Aspergillus tubingensis]|nr:Golgi uridine diphosphate-N-acetylglucosamine transporter [Aspergillus tubingensis]
MSARKDTVYDRNPVSTQTESKPGADYKLETTLTSGNGINNVDAEMVPKQAKRNNEVMGPTGATSGHLTSVISATTHTVLPQWTNIILMFSLIFGGCCANVFALEAIIKDQPSSVYTAFFVTVNLLNNWAFAYRISVPLHIILRSGGPVASMIIGYLFNAKRYSRGQILAVLMLTLGVVTAALADAKAKGQSMNVESTSATTTLVGFTILALAMILSAFQGIYADRLYAKYGRDHWKEALFYSHTLSLPLFLPAYAQLVSQWRMLFSTYPPTSGPEILGMTGMGPLSHASSAGLEGISSSEESCEGWRFASIPGGISGQIPILKEIFQLHSIFTCVPTRVIYLLINALTQYLCIRGVHRLSAKSSSLTVTVVLNVRKLVSLLLSIYLFGNALSPGVLMGALFVFIGGALYGIEGARPKVKTAKND